MKRIQLTLSIVVTDEELLAAAAAKRAAKEGFPLADWLVMRTGPGDDLIMLLDAGSNPEIGYDIEGATAT